MARKTVYCRINERIKRLTYTKGEGETDLAWIDSKFWEVVSKDAGLNESVGERGVAFQFTDGRGKLCDLEDDDNVADGSDIIALIVTKGCGIKQVIPAIEVVKPPTTPPLNNVDISAPSRITRQTQKKAFGKVRVPYPAQLPELTGGLKSYLDNGELVSKQRFFVHFWAADLLRKTDNRPTNTEYLNYAKTVVQAYPALKGGNHECGVLKSNLSTHIKNARYYRKKTMKRKLNAGGMTGTMEKSTPSSSTRRSNTTTTDRLKSSVSDAMVSIRKLASAQLKEDTVSSAYVRYVGECLAAMDASRRSMAMKEMMDVLMTYGNNDSIIEHIDVEKVNEIISVDPLVDIESSDFPHHIEIKEENLLSEMNSKVSHTETFFKTEPSVIFPHVIEMQKANLDNIDV